MTNQKIESQDWIEKLRSNVNSSSCVNYCKLDSDVTSRALLIKCSRQQIYAEYARAFADEYM